jgi:hypothetical protein
MKKVVNRIKKIGKNVLVRARHDDLLYLFLELAGGALILSVPPLGAVAIYLKIFQEKNKLYTKKQLRNSFYYFRKKGLMKVESDKGNTIIMLTEEGKSRAKLCGAGRILSGKLKEKLRWDGKWRIVVFDLENNKTSQRDAMRLFLKRCGFALMQKSVWIYPYDCSKEIEFIRSFFRLSAREFRFITCDNIGDDLYFRNIFNL